MTITARIKATITAAKLTSRPVWAFLAAETIAAITVAVALVLVVGWMAESVALDELPPWRALAVFPVVGVAAQLARAAGAGEALRRWHGVAVRRIDERWGDER
jgi:hypothetical protein